MRLLPAVLPVLLLALPAHAEWKRLYADHAEASSALQSNWNKFEENFHPSYVLDDDPRTAWVEGAAGDGLGEKLTIPLTRLASARAVKLVIFNGFQFSQKLLVANAAPKVLRVVASLGKVETGAASLTLERKLGPQSFEVPLRGGLSTLTFTLESVHPGTVYRDTCLSDVQVFVDSDAPYDAAVEKAKQAALLGWRKERLDRAKDFARLPATYAYAGTHLQQTGDDADLETYCLPAPAKPRADAPPPCPVKPGVMALSQRLSRGQALGGLSAEAAAQLRELQDLEATFAHKGPAPKSAWFVLTPPARHAPAPEGFPLPFVVEPLLHVKDATLFEAQGPAERAVTNPDANAFEQARSTTTVSNALLLEGTAAAPRKLYLRTTVVNHELPEWTQRTGWLATWDEQGRLLHLVSRFAFVDPGATHEVASDWSVTLKEGRVAGLKRAQLSEDVSYGDPPGATTLVSQHREYSVLP